MLVWFEVIGYTVLLEPDVAPGQAKAERRNYTEVVLRDRLYQALQRINPNVPSFGVKAAIRKITGMEPRQLEANHRSFRQFLMDGMDVCYQLGKYKLYNEVKLIDPCNLLKNDWLAIHQFTVVEGKFRYRPEVVVFINGLPLAIIEITRPPSDSLTFKQAYQKIQKSKPYFPSLFSYNQILIISDGNQARVGTLCSDWEEFIPWHAIDGENVFLKGTTELEILIQDFFDKRCFFKLMRDFIEFEEVDEYIDKKDIKFSLSRASAQ